jgi:hypothetical protein
LRCGGLIRIFNQKENVMNQTPEQFDGLVRRLNEGGCPVLADHSYKITPVGLVIEKIPGLSFSSIFDVKQGGAGYAIEMSLRNEATRPIDIVGWQVQTPWGIPKLALLPAPKRSSNWYPHYCFPEPGPYFDGDFCINRYFARRKSRLQPGESIEGVIVASSEDPIPPGNPAPGARHCDSSSIRLAPECFLRTISGARKPPRAHRSRNEEADPGAGYDGASGFQRRAWARGAD